MAAARDIGRGDGDVVAGATHELYNRYGRQIYAYCLHHLRSREEAEDAVQTTFMNAFRGLQRGTVAQCEQAWLFKIAHNVCVSRQSSSWRRRRIETPNDFEVLQEIIPSPPRNGADELIGLEAALEAMPENQRRAILLREWHGLSYREVAEELQLTQSAVEMLIFRARRSLASALEPDESTDKVGPRLDLGSLLTGLKSALTGGAAVKLMAAAVAASTVGIAAPPLERSIVKRTTRQAASRALTAQVAVSAPAPLRRVVAQSSVRASVSSVVPVRSAHASAVVRAAVAGGGRGHESVDAPVDESQPVPAAAPVEQPAPVVATSAPAPSAPASPPQSDAVQAPAVTVQPSQPSTAITLAVAMPGNGKSHKKDKDGGTVSSQPAPVSPDSATVPTPVVPPPVTTPAPPADAPVTTLVLAASPPVADPHADRGNHGNGNGHSH